MSGGAQGLGQAGAGAAAASAGSAASTAASAGAAGAGANNMPQWLKGYLGATTGNPQYGQNAPLIHQALKMGMGAMGQGGQMPPQMAQMQPRPPAQPQPMQQMPGSPVQGSPMGGMPQGMPQGGPQMPGMGGPQMTPAMLNQMLAQKSGLMS